MKLTLSRHDLAAKRFSRGRYPTTRPARPPQRSRSDAESMSSSTGRKATLRPERLARVSDNAAELDQRTPENGRSKRGRRPAQPHQPIAAVRRGAEDGVVTAKQPERPGDLGARDTRNIRTDNYEGTLTGTGHDPLHAGAEIAPALRRAPHIAAPPSRPHTPVRRNGEDRLPRAMTSHAVEQTRRGMAGKSRGGSHARFLCQPRLDQPRDGNLRHHHEAQAKGRRLLRRRPS